MGGRSSRDYAGYEAEFVTSSQTMRGFAREKGIPSSALGRIAAKPDVNGMTWYDKQKAYLANKQERAYEILADHDAIQLSVRMERMLRISDRMLGVIEKQIPVWEAQIDDGKTPINPKDVTAVIDQMRALIGQHAKPESKEDRRFGFLGIVASDGGIDHNLARQLEAAARPLLVDTGPDSAGPVPVAEDAGSH